MAGGEPILNLLIVDDETLEVEQLEYLIESLYPAWQIFKAYDGKEALDVATSVVFDLALLDIHLPEMSGLQLGSALREKQPELDIVMVTASHDFYAAQQSIKLGVVDYLTKPIIRKELEQILKRYELGQTPIIPPEYCDIVGEAILFMHRHYDEHLSLSIVASWIHVNPSYLSRKFHEEVKVPFSEYLNQYRIEMSKKWLVENPDLTIGEIAEKVGFSNQYYFSTLFRKSVGMSPTQFRNQQSGDNQ
ncbi:response regulator transcription factor [Rubeoparvulum massiliense]|uniref:response regulator transcription factor n=1 Tax=Rubeoparvulum massiliense TaxID=1631346 RepID=UPI00065E0316|nr:response regulator [Rubeoparvulum massiliense]